MFIALEDPDIAFAQSLTMAAARRGHMAKHLISLREPSWALPADPEVVVLGGGRLDRVALDRLAAIRSQYDRAVILLVVEQSTASDTMTAFELGAGYVLHKPLAPSEVIRWLERVPELRRSAPRKTCVGDLEIELDEMRATKAGRELALTRSEFYLLSCLVEHAGRVTSIDRLLTLGGEIDEIAYSSLKTHMSRLRQKLRLAGGVPIRISAKQLLGYVLEPVSGECSEAISGRIDHNAAQSGQGRDAPPTDRPAIRSAHVRTEGTRSPRVAASLASA